MLFAFLLALAIAGPAPAHPDAPVHVDDAGVLRWTETGEEVALFGVNYSTPFAYAYRAHAQLGVDHEAAIDADVAHMARLGFDAFRVHVWDREVSDGAGNLLENEHLRLLDYLLARLQERGIYALLTPIAWWGTGWPEPDPPAPGFSSNYSKAEMSVDPISRAAQKNYLTQFLEHVNPYTGLSYRDDPNIIAIELFNEPAHLEPPAETTRYINELVGVVRGTGFNKPIFYNVSQNWSPEHAAAVAAAHVQGVSFQWYPTGLVRNATLPGNYLPNVDRYPIPAEGIPGFDRLARMVYEFDAADIAEPYIYPAMVRSFREAGMQWATHFSYDPLAIAYANTEYGTHFVNLVYTPAKAISLMIAAEAFRQLPRGQSYDNYPESARFGPVRVSYEERLSELVTEDRFLYSNDTSTAPPAPERLRHVAGVGTSPVVAYGGTGAYFLDRLEDGVWRLEVYPDAVWVRDPYGPTSLSQAVSRLFWRSHSIAINLPDLGSSFHLTSLSDGDRSEVGATNGTIAVEPGVYMLTRGGLTLPDLERLTPPHGLRLREYHVPEAAEGTVDVVHDAPPSVPASTPFTVRATVASNEAPDSVWLALRRPGWRGFARVEMQNVGPYAYEAALDGPWQNEGPVEYFITVHHADVHRTFPGDLSQRPGQWDFVGGPGWQTMIADAGAPATLFRARRDARSVIYPHQERGMRYEASVATGSSDSEAAVVVRTDDLSRVPHYLAVGIPVSLLDAEREWTRLSFSLRSLNPTLDSLTVTLLLDDGSAWGGQIATCLDWCRSELAVADLVPTRAAALPRAYPFFLPFWLGAPVTPSHDPDLRRLQSIQIGIDARLRAELREAEIGFALQDIKLR